MIEINIRDIDKIHEAFAVAPKDTVAAVCSAVNRTLTHVRANVSKGVRAEYFAKAKDIKGTLKLDKASHSELVGIVKSTGRPLNLTSFRVSNSRTRPLKAQVKRGGAARTVPGLFRGTARSGYKGLMHRYTRKSYPLRVPYGPSVPQMIGNEDVVTPIAAEAEEYLSKRITHELERRLK